MRYLALRSCVRSRGRRGDLSRLAWLAVLSFHFFPFSHANGIEHCSTALNRYGCGLDWIGCSQSVYPLWMSESIDSFAMMIMIMTTTKAVVDFEAMPRIHPKTFSFLVPSRTNLDGFPFVGIGSSRGGHFPRLLS